MADITLTRGSTLPDSSAKSDFHGLVDNATASISNIVNADISNSAAIASSKVDLSAVGQKIIMSSKAIDTAKGSDIASATTTDIGAATGNFVDITGTTTITGLGTIQAGSIRFARFTGILTLTHNGTSLILPTTANITTAAGDRAIFVSLGSGNWLCLAYQRADGTPLGSAYTPTAGNALSGSVVQVVFTKSSAVATDSGTAVDDDSIPTVTECPILTALNTSITASSASNTLIITACLNVQVASQSAVCIVGLFIDSGTDAIAAARILGNGVADIPFQCVIQFSVNPADTSAHTYKIGIGGTDGVMTVNGSSGSRRLGGVLYSSVKIEEIKA